MPSDDPGWRRPIRLLAREPLLQFLLLGLLLVVVGRWADPPAPAPAAAVVPPATVIRLGPEVVGAMQTSLRRELGRAPTAAEWQQSVEARLRAAMLAREALARGASLDEAVERRLATALERDLQRVVAPEEPTEAELRHWFERRPERYAVLPAMTLRQVAFGLAGRGEHARADVVAARQALDAGGEPPAGDRVGLPPVLRDYRPAELIPLLGTAAAEEAANLPPGRWSAPILGPRAWHLLRVEARDPPTPPTFEGVRAAVREDWLAVRRAAALAEAEAEIANKYSLEPPAPPPGLTEALSP